MGNNENGINNLLEQARTCKIDLIALLEEIDKELENNKDNKALLEAKRVVKDRMAVREAITGIPQYK